jgi:hypothetical protein
MNFFLNYIIKIFILFYLFKILINSKLVISVNHYCDNLFINSYVMERIDYNSRNRLSNNSFLITKVFAPVAVKPIFFFLL